MEITFTTTPAAALEAGALVALAFSRNKNGDEKPADAPVETSPAGLDAFTGGWVSEVYAAKEFCGKSLETALLHRPSGLKASRLVLAGAGSKSKFGASEARKLAGAVLRKLKGKGISDFALCLEGEWASSSFVEALTEGFLLGDFEPDAHKTDPKKDEKKVERIQLSVPSITAPLTEALERGRIVAEAQNFTRTLITEPANFLTPLKLAGYARAMAADFGLECDILDEARMKQLGFGALLGVAQGSAEPPCLIVLKYVPSTPAADGDHLALVGKGVTFDTGGISIKPSADMDKMKYDMSGAATVIGAMRALAQLKPAIPVTAFAPCVENMPSDRAQRPGDIVKSYQGKTIEVLNTDAEGRLILADALTYAVRQGCTHLVDAATLTGAIAIALGHLYAGIFSNNEEFQSKVIAAGKVEGERLWPFPMDDDYNDYLKSAFADLPNIGGRYGGSITASKFLENFVESKPWVHLDIASTAWLDDSKPYLAKGPTGLALRTMIRLALDWNA
ncbi:MAG: leucyl aminopeptidase [Bryobacteraceae bacterium]|nr:leucyl aminopeptidase [Bryobacteraceae bacterium]